MKFQLTADYSISSYWELDFDLNEVYDWHIKWDTLFVQFTEKDEEFVEFQPLHSASDDHEAYKYPRSTTLEVSVDK